MRLHLKEEHRVEFGEIDFKEKLTLNGIVYYMQQVAANHAIKLNFSYYKSEDKSPYYWVISRVKFIMATYPKWQEHVSIETYPGGYNKLFAVRLFDLTNEKGDKIGQFRIMEVMPEIEFEEVESFGNADRGGFGTTGKR